MDDASRIATAQQYLRRKYARDLAGLKALADRVAAAGAFEAVTLTGQQFEGGSAQGTLTFEPLAYLAAIEAIIAELDPDNTPPARPNATFARFGYTASCES